MEESEGLSKEQNKEKKKITMIQCKVIGDYFDVTKLLIENNVPIIQEYDF